MKGGGKLETLNEKSKAPHRRRRRSWPQAVTSEIRRLRTVHPNLSKEKLYPFLKAFCDAKGLCCPKAKTVGRIIADGPDKMRTLAWAKISGQAPPSTEEYRLPFLHVHYLDSLLRGVLVCLLFLTSWERITALSPE